MRNMKGAKPEKGFTIIELVVVILLLGILTATALPRFMDVTDQAHDAVVSGVQGGLNTGMALFHAQWIAENEDIQAAIGYGSGTLFANTDGYPIGTDNDFTLPLDGTDCLAIYNGLLQQGGVPTAAAATFSATAATLETNIEAAATSTVEVVATENDATTPTGCNFYYVGQYKEGSDASAGELPNRPIPVLNYDATTGEITAGTDFVLQEI